MLNIILAFSFLAMAVILDFIEGLDKDSQFNIYQMIINNYDLRTYTVEHFAKTIEELFEMIGISIFLVTFVRYTGKISTQTIKLI